MGEGDVEGSTEGRPQQTEEKLPEVTQDVESGRTPAILTVSSIVDTAGKPEQAFTTAVKVTDAIVNRSIRPSSKCLSSTSKGRRRKKCGLFCCGFGGPPTAGCCSGPATTGIQVILAAAIILIGLLCAGLLFGYLRCQHVQKATHERLQGLEEQRVQFEALRQSRMMLPQQQFLAPMRRPQPHFQKTGEGVNSRKRLFPAFVTPPAELQKRRGGDSSDEEAAASHSSEEGRNGRTEFINATVRLEDSSLSRNNGSQQSLESLTNEEKIQLNSTVDGLGKSNHNESRDAVSHSAIQEVTLNMTTESPQESTTRDTKNTSSTEASPHDEGSSEIMAVSNTSAPSNASEESRALLDNANIHPFAIIPPNDCGPGYAKDPLGKCRPVVHGRGNDQNSKDT